MKKNRLILSGLLLASAVLLQAQTTAISVNNTNLPEQKDRQYYINGISTQEDIGGVEVSRESVSSYSSYYNLIFENYNDFSVSVMYQVTDCDDGDVTGTIILKAGETKGTGDVYCKPSDYKLIVRRLGGAAQPAQSFAGEVQTGANNGVASGVNKNLKIGIVDSEKIMMRYPAFKELEAMGANAENEFHSYANADAATQETVRQQLAKQLSDAQASISKQCLNDIERAATTIGYRYGYVLIYELNSQGIIYRNYQVEDITELVAREMGL